MFVEGGECGERGSLYIAAVFAHTAEQGFPRGAERLISPTRVLVPGVALLPLQSPFQRIIHDPPGRIELGYEVIGGVRWALETLRVVSMPPLCR